MKTTLSLHRPCSTLPYCAIIAIVLSLAVPITAQAQLAYSLQEDADPNASPPAADGQLGSTLTLDELRQGPRQVEQERAKPKVVQPADEPQPALVYRFWPRERELHPGSAQLHFFRAVTHYLNLPQDERRKLSTDWFSDGPRPNDQERELIVDRFQQIYHEIRLLGQSEQMTWDHRWRDLTGTDIYMYLLHDVQEARTLARLLGLKIDHHLSRNEFTEAILCIQDGYRLAHFVCQGETIIQQLVGVAIASIMLDKAEQAIQNPGCPNLYWALASIPSPVSRMHRSLEIELGNMPLIFPVFAEVETLERENDYWLARWEESMQKLKELGGQNNDSDFSLALAPVMFVGPSKQRLLGRGLERDRVDQMPDMQAVFLDAAMELRHFRDELEKSSLLPYDRGRPLAERVETEFQAWVTERKRDSAAAAFASLLLPATRAAQEAEVRSVYMHNRLMTIEALRIHAARNHGRLPESLDDLETVPALDNPFTGIPFDYVRRRQEGVTVVELDGETPIGLRSLSKIVVHFRNPR